MLEKNGESPPPEEMFECVDSAIQKALGALKSGRNLDGGWGRFRGDESDLWNTSFILDCLLEVKEYKDIRNLTEESVEYIAHHCDDFLKSPEKKDFPTIYALAHSLCVLVKTGEKPYEKTGEKPYEDCARGILKYLVGDKARNLDGGWGWDEFSSSNIYGTAIVVNALINVMNTTAGKEMLPEIENSVCNGIKFIMRRENEDGGWGVEWGSDPKHTALELLALLRFSKHDNLKKRVEGEIKDTNGYRYKTIDEYIRNGFKWLSSESPRGKKSKFFKTRSRIPGRGWRVEESRQINRVGFEPTVYAVWALMKYEEFEPSENYDTKRKINKQFADGFLWLLYSQEGNGCWREYETEDNRMEGRYTFFYIALGILVLSMCKTKLKEIKNQGYLLREFIEKDLILLAKLSHFKDSKLITGSKRPITALKLQISIILSFSAAFVMILSIVLVIALAFLHKDQVRSGIRTFCSNPTCVFGYIRSNWILMMVVAVVVITLLIAVLYICKDSLMRKVHILEKYLTEVFFLLRGIVDHLMHRKESEIQEKVIQKAWEALIFSQNQEDRGWGRFRGDRSDLWNTSFILDCLLEVYEYEDIRNLTEKSVEYIAQHCVDFLENHGKEDVPTIYALAHSLSVLVKTGGKPYEGCARGILKYLVGDKARNLDGGWGWDEFSSSNIYGTAIVVNALMNVMNTTAGKKILPEIENSVCNGIKFIMRRENKDGGWGDVKGSDPKHTALELLALLRFSKHDNLKKRVEGEIKDINEYRYKTIDEYIRNGLKWMYSNRSVEEEFEFLIIHRNTSRRGWRKEDKRYGGKIGFEPTVYAVWVLIDLIELLKPEKKGNLSEKIKEDLEDLERNGKTPGNIKCILRKSFRWLLYHQGWNGYWYEGGTETERDGCTNFHLALGIQVLSSYKKRIEERNLENIMEKDLILLKRLSLLSYSKLITLSRRLHIVLSLLALSFIVVLVLAAVFLGREDITRIYNVTELIAKNPLYLAFAGIATLVLTLRKHMLEFLSKLKERVIYGRTE